MKKRDPVQFLGKAVLITGPEKILVVTDLHLGYAESLRLAGLSFRTRVYEEVQRNLAALLERAGKIDYFIILGDVKHTIGAILYEERKEIHAMISFIKEYAKHIVVIRGNHDALLEPLLRGLDVQLVDYFIRGEYAFLHGDRDFKEIYKKEVKCWCIGHMHPAIILREHMKEEHYKCFLDGSYKRKRLIVLPSFFSGSEGVDPREADGRLAWPVHFNAFSVRIVGENLEVLDFGILRKIR